MTNVDRVARRLAGQQDFVAKAGEVVRRALDFVLDRESGRQLVAELEVEAKAFVGKKVEMLVGDAFGLVRGSRATVVESG
jgi:hypothetical protein